MSRWSTRAKCHLVGCQKTSVAARTDQQGFDMVAPSCCQAMQPSSAWCLATSAHRHPWEAAVWESRELETVEYHPLQVVLRWMSKPRGSEDRGTRASRIEFGPPLAPSSAAVHFSEFSQASPQRERECLVEIDMGEVTPEEDLLTGKMRPLPLRQCSRHSAS